MVDNANSAWELGSRHYRGRWYPHGVGEREAGLAADNRQRGDRGQGVPAPDRGPADRCGCRSGRDTRPFAESGSILHHVQEQHPMIEPRMDEPARTAMGAALPTAALCETMPVLAQYPSEVIPEGYCASTGARSAAILAHGTIPAHTR